MISNQPTVGSMAKSDSNTRIDFIDGFRGVAILLVVAFHYFSRWGGASNRDPYPFGDIWVEFPLFKYGFYGVQLFFVVSGFVIAMTLERTSGLLEFVVRRFARLWPAILLCSILTFAALSIWPDFWPQSFRNFIPSLTFVNGVIWEKLWPGLDAQYVDGVYWTLFVEVRFYFYAGLIYFCSPRHFSRNFAGFVVAIVVLYCVSHTTGHARIAGIASIAFVAPYLPWFTGGLAAYDWSRGRKRSGIALAVISSACMLWLWMLNAPNANVLVALIVAVMFAGCFAVDAVRRVFAVRWLGLIGLSSYTLYLLHQRIGITLTAKVAAWSGWTGPSSVAIAVAMMILMICASHWIYRYWEHPWNRNIVRWYHNTAGSPVEDQAKTLNDHGIRNGQKELPTRSNGAGVGGFR